MTPFFTLDNYNAILVIFLGLTTILAITGCGLLLCRLLRLKIPEPWLTTVSAVLGILAISLVVQTLAILGVAGKAELTGTWVALLFVGLPSAFLHVARFKSQTIPRLKGIVFPIVVLGAIAILINLLIASGPSTKADEIFYHMLVPSRIALDGLLHYYHAPWLTAVLPQFIYQIAGTPLYALGYPDATNVMSWFLGLLLTWFAYRLIYKKTGSLPYSVLSGVSIQIGLYPSVWYTTAGPHAFGDLTTAVAILALLYRNVLLKDVSNTQYAVLISILCVGAAATKASLLPLSLIILAIGLAQCCRPRVSLKVLFAFVLPWVIFYLPITAWTFVQSGSPFGPILKDVFSPSIFGEMVEKEILDDRHLGQVGLIAAVKYYVISTSPLIWVGGIAALVLTNIPSRRRLLSAALLGFQLLLISLFLPHAARFLAGIPYALFICGAIEAYPWINQHLRKLAVTALVATLAVLPWLGTQVYRAWDLLPVSLGLEDSQSFSTKYIALYTDFLALDQILPTEAVLCVSDFRIASIYSPRPVFMSYVDLPRNRPAFALLIQKEKLPGEMTCADLGAISGCELGRIIYENEDAAISKFRTPGRPPKRGQIQVREILRSGT